MRHTFQTLAEVFEYSTSKYAKRPAYDLIDGDQSYTYAGFRDTCHRLSCLLSNFGINSGDKVAIFSPNMPNWPAAFFSITAFGRIAVPLLTELSENEITNILTHSDTKALFVSRRLLAKVPEELLERMHLVILTDDLSIVRSGEGAYTCDGTISSPLSDDVACLIYTSGTTGAAKGVMLTHKNFCVNIRSSWDAHKVRRRDVFLSILPLAHTYEMSIGMLYPFAVGARVYYLKRPPTPSVLIPNFKKIRPTCMLSVPLVIEKIYRSSIVPTVENSKFLSHLRKFSPAILARLVGVRLRKTFGGRLKFFGIGGAKLDGEVEAFLRRARFPYSIGYGLTETAPLIGYARVGETVVGSFGNPAYGVQMRLEDVNPETGEGEIVVKGDNVMKGYYKDYARTCKVLSPDGWFHTGDVASLDKRGRYYIKGRLGSVILGPSGENIYPEEIEAVIDNIKDISESLVVQRGGHLVALVHFNDNILDWNYENHDRFMSDLEKRKQAILDFVNSHVNRSSQIKEVEVEKQPFAKTATMKIKRFLYKEKKNEGTDK
ncbi:MAG: AMP-binding protein [Bacteroidales bacterium]|nr:AMP-binding protein [Bacteroidales bacterium]